MSTKLTKVSVMLVRITPDMRKEFGPHPDSMIPSMSQVMLYISSKLTNRRKVARNYRQSPMLTIKAHVKSWDSRSEAAAAAAAVIQNVQFRMLMGV